jgi:organic hydroperoxide reductase OsmC/OhrA
MAETQEPTRRYKSFSYSVETAWSHDRQGALTSDGKPVLEVASPPEFRGVPGVWTPEDLFVAAIDACQMTTFLALAFRARLALNSYRSHARGVLEHSEGGYRFTSVALTPTIGVGEGTDVGEVQRLVEEAHKSCLIARSLTTRVEVQANIIIEA